MDSENIVFEERKRLKLFGLPWTFTKYIITEDNILIQSGFLNGEENDCYMYKVQDVVLTESLIQRLFKLGTVKCFTGDVTDRELFIVNIRNAREIKNYLLKASENARLKRRTVNTLNIGADDESNE